MVDGVAIRGDGCAIKRGIQVIIIRWNEVWLEAWFGVLRLVNGLESLEPSNGWSCPKNWHIHVIEGHSFGDGRVLPGQDDSVMMDGAGSAIWGMSLMLHHLCHMLW